MLHADHRRLQRIAQIQAESAGTVLLVVSVASVVSLLGTVVELSAARAALSHLALALSTVVGSWLLLPTEFSLSYASIYYALPVPGGLGFPGAEPHFKPDYGDFLYVSMTIAVACQMADVTVTTQSMRRPVLLQSLLSFAFNIAAGLFGGALSRLFGSGAGDCAPAPSHTTGQAVFSHPAVERSGPLHGGRKI